MLDSIWHAANGVVTYGAQPRAAGDNPLRVLTPLSRGVLGIRWEFVIQPGRSRSGAAFRRRESWVLAAPRLEIQKLAPRLWPVRDESRVRMLAIRAPILFHPIPC